jgi:hypothetical protein
MMPNAFDDIPPVGAQAPPPTLPIPPAKKGNAFDDLMPVETTQKIPPAASMGLPPATAADRLQAGEAGFLKGTAYLAGMIPDAFANVGSLGVAGYDAIRHAMGTPWEELPRPWQPNPTGAAISRQMDKSPITTTQVARPDDTASRYLSTAGSVVPGVLSGGGGLAQTARGIATAVPPALAGQAVYEAKPFKEDWKNQAAAIATQVGGTLVMPRGRGADQPEKAVSNQTVREGQDAGYKYPPATTNPTSGNRTLESIASKVSVQQHAALNNQNVTNALAREELELPGKGPIAPEDIAQIRVEENPNYQAIRQAGPIDVQAPDFHSALKTAAAKFNGASNVSPTLAKNDLNPIIQDILSKPAHDAGDLMDTVGLLRDKASSAYRNGDAGTGAAYKAVGKAIEDQIDRHLTAQGGASSDLVEGFRDARTRLAKAHTVEDALNPGTGNVDALKLRRAYLNGDYMDGNLETIAKSASVAPRAFAEPTSSAASNHLGLWGTLGGMAGLAAGGEHFLPGHMGLAAAAAPVLYAGARAGARSYVLGPGQANALALQRAPLNPSVVLGQYLAAQGRKSVGDVPETKPRKDAAEQR